MGNDVVKVKKTYSKPGLGRFFLGIFLGIILGIGLLVGGVALIYFNVSPEWINNTFKTEIDLGSEEINKKTLNDLVSVVVSIGTNLDTYTIENFEEDFGIEVADKLLGSIDITDLKKVAVADLPQGIEDKFKSISAKELEGLFSSEALEDIMAKTVTYYYKEADNKLYKDAEFAESLSDTFEYTVENNKVKIKTFDPVDIVEGKVELTLNVLPLSVALDEFTSSLGENLTLQELKTEYGVDLPSYIYEGNETKTVNEISEIINDIELSKILELKYDDTFETYYTDNNNNKMYDSGEEVSAVLNSIATTKVDELAGKIKTLTIKDIFKTRTGILSLIAEDTTIEDIPAAAQNVIKNKTINDLKDVVISLDDADEAKLTILVDHDGDSSTAKKAVGALTINELLDYCFDLIPTT